MVARSAVRRTKKQRRGSRLPRRLSFQAARLVADAHSGRAPVIGVVAALDVAALHVALAVVIVVVPRIVVVVVAVVVVVIIIVAIIAVAIVVRRDGRADREAGDAADDRGTRGV